MQTRNNSHHQHKEDKEDVRKEEDGPQDSVCCFEIIEVEVAQDESEESESMIFLHQISHNEIVTDIYLHSSSKGAVILDLCPKQQVAQLSEGEKDDEEHDPEAGNVFGTARQGRRKL